MAKFFLLNKFGKRDHWAADLPSGNLWEDWIDTQAVMHPAERLKPKVDEHEVWEKAVHFGMYESKG